MCKLGVLTKATITKQDQQAARIFLLSSANLLLVTPWLSSILCESLKKKKWIIETLAILLEYFHTHIRVCSCT